MEHKSEELKRLDSTVEIYKTEDGQLNRDIISANSAKLIEMYFPKGGRAIQMGLGDGFIAEKLCNHFDVFDIVEGSQVIIDEYKTKPEKVRIFKSLFEDYVPQEKYDVLLGNHILEHVDEPVEIIKQGLAWLKPGGKAIFTVPHAQSLHRRIGVEMKLLSKLNELNSQDIRLGHRRVYTIPEFEKDIKAGGFKNLKTFGYMIKLVSNKQMKGWSEELLDAIFKISLSSPPEICSNIAVICEA